MQQVGLLHSQQIDKYSRSKVRIAIIQRIMNWVFYPALLRNCVTEASILLCSRLQHFETNNLQTRTLTSEISVQPFCGRKSVDRADTNCIALRRRSSDSFRMRRINDLRSSTGSPSASGVATERGEGKHKAAVGKRECSESRRFPSIKSFCSTGNRLGDDRRLTWALNLNVCACVEQKLGQTI